MDGPLEKADIVVGTITPTFGPWLNFTRDLISKTGPTIGDYKIKMSIYIAILEL